jgi:hypothetical protein
VAASVILARKVELPDDDTLCVETCRSDQMNKVFFSVLIIYIQVHKLVYENN